MAGAITLVEHDDLTSWDADPSPAHPHVALLLGASLLSVVLVCVLPVLVLHQVRPEMTTVYLTISLAAGLAGVAPFVSRRFQTRWYASAALLTFDALPLIMAATVEASVPSRAWASLILVPVVLTASTANARTFRIELALGAVLGLILLATGAPSVPEAVLTCGGFVFFLIVCANLTRQDWAALHARFAELQLRSQTDELTGLLNRRGLVAQFPELRRRAQAASSQLGMIMIDIDHFSRINTDHGHEYGDGILKNLCDLVLGQPGMDGGLVARIGGEELLVVIPRPAGPVAQAISTAVAAARIHPGLTVSMGLTDKDPVAVSSTELLWRLVNLTDSAMYRAKSTGRNRVERATGEASATATPPTLPAMTGSALDRRLDELPAATPAGALDGRADERLDYRLFGAFMVVFAVIGALAYSWEVAIDRTSPWAAPFLMLLLLCGAIGVAAVVRGRRLGRTLATLSVLSFELATITCMLATKALEHRMLEVCLLAMPALVAAHSMSRGWALFHGALVFVAAGLATRDAMEYIDDASWVYWTLSLGVALSAAPAVLFWLRERRAAANARLRQLTSLDPLTGVHNRRGLERAVLAAGLTEPRHLLEINIDGFKKLNDSYGHVFGDDVLRLLADIVDGAVKVHVRLHDAAQRTLPIQPVVGRTGGDRFVVISTGAADPGLTRRVKQSVVVMPTEISVSFGEAHGRIADAVALWSLVAQAESGLARPRQTR